MNSLKPIRFEPRWRSADSALDGAVDTLTLELENFEASAAKRQRQRKKQDREKFRLAVECIAANLLVAAKANSGASIAIPLANQASQFSSIYGAHFRNIVDLMHSLGLISRTIGYRHSRKARKASTIRATRRLYRYLPTPAAIDWDAFRLDADKEARLILLRPEKGHESSVDDVAFPETKQTRRWEREVRFINDRLADAPITIAGKSPKAFFHLNESGSEILRTLTTGHHRLLRRVFNNGDTTGADWSEGGRLAGGYWMTMERKKRFQEIRIGGEPIVNVDFQQLFLRLAYAHAQQNMIVGPEGTDAYVAGKGKRDGWKRLTNALIFRKSPLNQWPGRDRQEREKMRGYFPRDTKPSAAIAAIKQKHAAIADCFECGLGFRFMRTESDILIAGVIRLFEEGIVALPLHDAVLVAESQAKRAQAIMEAEALRKAGAFIPAKIETAAAYGVAI